jgi:hypothetical protein
MNMYQVTLTKSYLVKIKSNSQEEAMRLAEFYTGDISDISNVGDQIKEKFSIEEIECTVNDAVDCENIENE